MREGFEVRRSIHLSHGRIAASFAIHLILLFRADFRGTPPFPCSDLCRGRLLCGACIEWYVKLVG
jgi:hypothetical protein